MNKLTKGVIAAAAGVILLSGGAGTFAAWNNQATIAGGTISTGSLSIATAGSASWKDALTGSTLTGSALSGYVFAPGDEIKYTQNVLVTVTGADLVANLAAVVPGITDVSTGTAASQFHVTTSFDTANAVSPTNVTVTAGTATGTYDIKNNTAAGTGTVTIPVIVDITFDAAAGNSTESSSVTLAGTKINLTQTAVGVATPIS